MAVNSISRNDLSGLIPEPISAEIIQGVTEGSAILQMGRRLPNMTSKNLSMNVLDMLPTAYFVDGDNGTKQTTKMAWDKKKIVAEEIAVIVPIPEAVLDDATYDIWGEVKPRIMKHSATRLTVQSASVLTSLLLGARALFRPLRMQAT